MLIEASVLARLLGIKLLTLEGSVLVTPAELHDGWAPAGRPSAPPGPALEAARSGTPPRSAGRDAAIGASLGATAGLLTESTRELRALELWAFEAAPTGHRPARRNSYQPPQR